MSDIEFIEGLSFKAPNDGAPDFVLAKGWIKNAELIAFLQARIAKGEESTNFDLKKSKGGKPYAALDNWKPSGGGQRTERQAKPAPADDFDPDRDLPF
jgi:hypothetical protein